MYRLLNKKRMVKVNKDMILNYIKVAHGNKEFIPVKTEKLSLAFTETLQYDSNIYSL